MKLVLLVHNSLFVRETLTVILRQHHFKCTVAATRAEAEALLSVQTPDLIILDLRTPGPGGIELLKQIREHPLRRSIPVVALTGIATKEIVAGAMQLGISGYFLEQQFGLTRFIQTLQRARHIEPRVLASLAAKSAGPAPASPAKPTPAANGASQELTDQDAIIDPVEALKSLKPIVRRSEIEGIIDQSMEVKALSPVVAQILSLTRQQGCSIDAIVKAVRMDHAIAMKLLKLANSSVYTRGEPVDSIKKAVVRIGFDEMRTAVMNLAVIDQFSDEATAAGLDIAQFWEHAISTGVIAAKIAASVERESTEAAFTMGLLHDIGRAILASELGDRYLDVANSARQLQLPLEQVESRVLLFDHAQAMDRVLHKWGFPKHLINPIVFHHLSAANIRGSAPREATTVAILALANRLSHALLLGSSGNETVYPAHDLVQLLRLEPRIIEDIEKTARDETNDLKFSLLSKSDLGNWPERRLTVMDAITVPFRPVFISETPETDILRIFTEQVVDPCDQTPTNIAVVHIQSSRDRVALGRTLIKKEEELKSGKLPLLLISANGALELDGSVMQGRRFARLRSPFAVSRFAHSVNTLLTAQPAAESPAPPASAKAA